jgi:formamidopyrimidine-DNA glycosylase
MFVVPELPEVEVLVRYLRPLLIGRTIDTINVRRTKTTAPTDPAKFRRLIKNAQFTKLSRRGKYLIFELRDSRRGDNFTLLGHLGMTGRMYLLPQDAELPKHAAVVLGLGKQQFVFEDTRYFGRFTLDCKALEKLGPEPLEENFTVDAFGRALKRSAQSIKVKLLDQTLVAGIGNIYASEALFRAGISPRVSARRLKAVQIESLWRCIREVLVEAIECGSTVPLNYSGTGERDGLFYFGRLPETSGYYEERLRVYDRAGQPCVTCSAEIKRFVQAARSTFFCPTCQGRRGRPMERKTR